MSSARRGTAATSAIVFSVVQIAVQSVVLFLTYRFAVLHIGLALLGVWSVASAAVTFGRIGDLGFGGAMPRLLAGRLAPHADEAGAVYPVTVLVETATLSSTVGSLVLATLMYWPLVHFTASIKTDTDQALVMVLVAGASAALLFTAMSATFSACLDALGQFRLRALTSISGTLLNLAVIGFAIRPLGVTALPVALIVQGVWTTALTWWFLRRELPDLSIVPSRWSAAAFRDLLSIGKFTQTNSILIMLFEPLSRVLAGKFGGAEFAALFDLAARMSGNLRLLFSSASLATVPFYAFVHQRPERAARLYESSASMTSLLVAVAVLLAAGFSPLLSLLALNAVNVDFLRIFWLLLAGSLFSVIGGPAFAHSMGVGRVSITTRAFFVQTAVFLLGVPLLAIWFTDDAVSVAYSAALACAGIYLLATIRNGDDAAPKHALRNMLRSVMPVTGALVAGIVLASQWLPNDRRSLVWSAFLLPLILIADLAIRFHADITKWFHEINGFRIGSHSDAKLAAADGKAPARDAAA